MKKNIKNATFIPAYVIDITKAKTADDVMLAVIGAKLSVMFTENDIDALIDTVVIKTYHMVNEEWAQCMDDTKDALMNGDFAKCDMKLSRFDSDIEKIVISNNGIKIKKANIFKRFWRWITRKK